MLLLIEVFLVSVVAMSILMALGITILAHFDLVPKPSWMIKSAPHETDDMVREEALLSTDFNRLRIAVENIAIAKEEAIMQAMISAGMVENVIASLSLNIETIKVGSDNTEAGRVDVFSNSLPLKPFTVSSAATIREVISSQVDKRPQHPKDAIIMVPNVYRRYYRHGQGELNACVS